MKVGSLCEFIGPNPYHIVDWAPKKGDILTIRQFAKNYDGEELAMFEEGIMGYNLNGDEWGCPLKFLRELLPPEEIAEALAEVNEDLKYREAPIEQEELV